FASHGPSIRGSSTRLKRKSRSNGIDTVNLVKEIGEVLAPKILWKKLVVKNLEARRFHFVGEFFSVLSLGARKGNRDVEIGILSPRSNNGLGLALEYPASNLLRSPHLRPCKGRQESHTH